jgi:hypothetical protein
MRSDSVARLLVVAGVLAHLGGSDMRSGAAFVWAWPQGVKQGFDYVNPTKQSAPYGFADDPGQKGLCG